ncbi:histidinol-phosphatase (PHP family) [Cytobacillus horneckiae]|uniref:histidinol-phosphatase HisJ n=1 Tax=Cytobacillus horneckiae TaxID=549687 RepID=UPI0008264BBC|nr:histidinol-phosphatase HisJ [Cytobacillus horneckiae]MBN6888015.1 histidinol-phosphatase HisJ [Cytobacillus horneckiae]MEC1154998.1 histidinol-phosphatase HisJ [Cytobacillus horneckiae]MED2936096.1 histidinol-phosphatase HisJ [Cytobacillus horneckiae]NRG44742.1 histidinol-phosphatase HisJ [Bacillus sp. CRN 9]
MKKDGHIHTPYCPHGTKDSLQSYVERAISLGFEEITFTEHAPLPEGFTDPVPVQDSSMNLSDLQLYFTEIENLKKEYMKEIKINTGLEVDFIEGYESETERFLNEVGPQLDDAILSVHFLKYQHQYHCVDYSPKAFGAMIERYGSIDAVYLRYFQTLLMSINADLGRYKPKRIGHITLVKKFQKKYPPAREYDNEIDEVLNAIKIKHYELDYNGAGTFKPLCLETYPPQSIANNAAKKGIALIFGSDAHQVKDLGQGWEEVNALLNL